MRSLELSEVEPACVLLAGWFEQACLENSGLSISTHESLQKFVEEEGLISALCEPWKCGSMRKLKGDELARKMASLMALSSVFSYVAFITTKSSTENHSEPSFIHEDLMYCILSSLEQV